MKVLVLQWLFLSLLLWQLVELISAEDRLSPLQAGSLTVLFTDKTGTLTEGKQAVELFLSSDNIPYYKFDAIPAALAEQVAFAIRHNTPQMLGADKTEQAILSFLSSKEGEKNLTLIKGAPEIILAKFKLQKQLLLM